MRAARRFELTDAGRQRQLVVRAAKILAECEAAEDVTRAHARTPQGSRRGAQRFSNREARSITIEYAS